VDLEREVRRLRRGLLLTFVAVAVLALATACGRWLQPAVGNGAARLTMVQVRGGQRVCGSLGRANSGTLRVSVGGWALSG
jgi:hypothetical protein